MKQPPDKRATARRAGASEGVTRTPNAQRSTFNAQVNDESGGAVRPAGGPRGFTLVEMLVVIGIMGILTTSLLGAFGYVKTIAWKSRAQSQVSQVATALTVYLQSERSWPLELLNRNEFDDEACWVLQEAKLLDVKTWKDYPQKIKFEDSHDRYGFLDPWGRAAMRKNPKATESDVKAHRIQYRLDRDLNGYVDASEGAPQGAPIRASVIVWSRGKDGQDDANSKNPKAKKHYPYDDSLSWKHGEARKE